MKEFEIKFKPRKKRLAIQEDTRDESVLRALKKVDLRLDKMSQEETRSIEDWEFYFDVRQSEGLFKLLREKHISTLLNPDGTVTLTKLPIDSTE